MQTNLKNNSNLFEKIEQIIDYYGLKNVSGLAKRLNYSSPEKINRLKKDDTKPSFDIIQDISNEFEDLNMNWFLSDKGEMITSKIKDHIIKDSPADYNKTPTVITVDSINRENIVMVPHRIHAGYLNSYNDPQFIQTLPAYRLPNLNNGVFRMFEVEGNSMFPTFHDKSIVVGQFVENWEKDIKDNRCYVIISNEIEDGFVKRCVNKIKKYNNLICKSDNRRNYPAQNIDPSTIKEVWEVKASLNFQFPDPADLYDKVIDMEAELLSLKNILKNQKFLP